MRKATFKVGDKVYCPSFGTQIFKIKEAKGTLSGMKIEIDFKFDDGMTYYRVKNVNGRGIEYGNTPNIFHATAKNHALLEQLYGMEFEAPPKQKTPKEVIQVMLIGGWDSVPCIDVRYSSHKFFANKLDIQRQSLDFLIPFDPKTGKAIIDYVDGKIVTE